MKKYLITIIFCGFIAPSMTLGQNSVNLQNPFISRNTFKKLDTLDFFIKRNQERFIEISNEEKEINDDWLQKKREEAVHDARKAQLLSNLVYDDNFDRQITKQEIEASAHKKIKTFNKIQDTKKEKIIEDAIDSVMKFDANQDAIVTYVELLELTSRDKAAAYTRVTKAYEPYLGFDANKDRTVTVDEFTNELKRIFSYADTNNDQVIDQDEYNAFQEQRYKSRDTQKVTSVSLTEYPSRIRTSIVRMIINRAKVEDLYFDPPKEIASLPENSSTYVFHNQGGGATYVEPEKSLIVEGSDASWVFTSAWKIDKIGTSSEDTSGNEIIAFLPHVKKEVCLNLNSDLKLKGGLDGDGIPKGSKHNILPEFSHGMMKSNPGFSTSVDIIVNEPFVGQPFGCYDLSDSNGKAGDGPYVYYHVMVER